MKQLCAKTQMDTSLCACDPCEVLTIEPEAPAFAVVRMSDVPSRKTEWLIPDLLPASDVVVLIGEEGIGKGLWWIEQARELTRRGIPVLMIVSEDDPSRALRPRMEVAGVNLDLVHLIVRDRETLTGHPYLPTDTEEVTRIIEETGARMLLLDPWISTVPGNISLKDSQQARAALDPLTMLARRTETCILVVAHTNRTDGSLRDRVGLTAVLRQACRLLLIALEDPEDETHLLVGTNKANITGRDSASRWVKGGEGAAWRVRLLAANTGLSIDEWDEHFRAQADGRTTGKWLDVLKLAKTLGGMVSRGDIVSIYGGEEHADAADKAIGRWIGKGQIIRAERGTYEVPSALPPANLSDPPVSFTGGTGGNGTASGRTPHKTDTEMRGDSGGKGLSLAPDLLALEAELDRIEAQP